jgi:plasmid stabilization system protein ParE
MSTYRLRRSASRDLVEICKHIARDNPSAADNFAAELHQRLALFVRFPESANSLPILAEGIIAASPLETMSFTSDQWTARSKSVDLSMALDNSIS